MVVFSVLCSAAGAAGGTLCAVNAVVCAAALGPSGHCWNWLHLKRGACAGIDEPQGGCKQCPNQERSKCDSEDSLHAEASLLRPVDNIYIQ